MEKRFLPAPLIFTDKTDNTNDFGRYIGFIGANGDYGLFSFLSITVNRVLKIVCRRPGGVSIQNTTGIKKPRNLFFSRVTRLVVSLNNKAQ